MAKVIPNPQIAQEAAAWAVVIDNGSIDNVQRKELAQWLTASPSHVEELLLAASLLAGMSLADAKKAISIEALLREDSSDIVHLFENESPPSETQQPDTSSIHRNSDRSTSWKRPVLAASLATIALVGISLASTSGWKGETSSRPKQELAEADLGDLLSTGIGEQRSVVLDDGSLVHLNAYSTIRVDLNPGNRNIELVNGEALFKVAHDETRPFRVLAGDTIAQAVGTTFNVERTGTNVQVTVVEGRVLVKNDDGSSMLATPLRDREHVNVVPIILAAGQTTRVENALAIPTPKMVDVSAVTSWRQRELTFDADSLATIAEKFNRYNRVQIELGDRELAQSTFSGVFDADDPESFIAFLELTGRFTVDHSDPEKVVLNPVSHTIPVD